MTDEDGRIGEPAEVQPSQEDAGQQRASDVEKGPRQVRPELRVGIWIANIAGGLAVAYIGYRMADAAWDIWTGSYAGLNIGILVVVGLLVGGQILMGRAERRKGDDLKAWGHFLTAMALVVTASVALLNAAPLLLGR